MSNINTTSSSDFPESNKGMHYETRCSDLIKIIWHDTVSAYRCTPRGLRRAAFIWPSPADGVVGISASQLAYMLDGIDWRNPRHTFRPERAG